MMTREELISTQERRVKNLKNSFGMARGVSKQIESAKLNAARRTLSELKNIGVIGDVSISSISHVEIDRWAKEYASGTNDGFRRLDFFNGALTLKQKLEGTSDEC